MWRGSVPTMLGAWAVLVASTLCAAVPGRAEAQVAIPRTAVSVDYVGADGVYLTVGSDDGAARGDTVAVYLDDAATDPAGRVVFASVTRRRTVATVVDASLRLREGDVVFLPLVRPEPAAAPPARPPVQPAAASALERRRGTGPSGPRVAGRLALDVDARETRTAWSGDLFGETRRRFATPTMRLSVQASELPGGITVRASGRASYRYDELVTGPPPVSVRAYEIAAIKSFQRVPLEITVGRFSNPYEGYSAYWDGALLRLGRVSGPGVGVVAGFEPELHNEGFSRALPKLTAFADFAARGRGWRYDTDASFHLLRPVGGTEQRFVGWSQRANVGRLVVSQRLRLELGQAGEGASLSELRLRTAMRVMGPFRLRSTYRRSRSRFMLPPQLTDGTAPSVRREVTVGLDVSGEHGSVAVDGGRTDRDGDRPGWSLYGSAGLRLRPVGVSMSGRWWSRDEARSLSVAPVISLEAWSLEWRAGYRLYRMDDGQRGVTAHSAEGQIGMTLMRGTRVTVGGERQWGPNLSGSRVRLGIWQSF